MGSHQSRGSRRQRSVRASARTAVARAVGASTLLVFAVFAVFAAWEGTQSRRSATAHWSVLAAIACALVVAAAAGRRLQRKPSASWARDGFDAIGGDLQRRSARGAPMIAAVGTWATLVVATIAWDLYSFSRQVHSLPTLSHLVGDVTVHDWGRALVFAGWLALGACLAIGWRKRRTDEVTP